jgi:hypothetical protein
VLCSPGMFHMTELHMSCYPNCCANRREDAKLVMVEGVLVVDVSVIQPVAVTDACAALAREGVAAAACDSEKLRACRAWVGLYTFVPLATATLITCANRPCNY